MSPQYAEWRCPKCADGGAVIREKIGRTVHSVCIQCSWCLTHTRYFPSAAKLQEVAS